MSGQVSAKSRAHSERGATYVTDKRLIACVNTNVICQARRGREAAVAGLAHVWLDASVSSHVIGEG